MQNWRAVAVLANRRVFLLCLGHSRAQVTVAVPRGFALVLNTREQELTLSIRLEQWAGSPHCGSWRKKDNLPVPHARRKVCGE